VAGISLTDHGKKNSSKTSFPENAQPRYDKLNKIVQNWMYSWMKPNCQTMEEYILSKYLLHRYISSPTVVEKVSTLMYEHFVIYLKANIETHESKYLFCLRKHVRHYAEYSNTILEGCNNAIKYHSSSVTPATRLDNSFTIIANNSDLKNVEMDKTLHSQFHSKPSLRNRTSDEQMCATHLTQMAYETILNSFNHSKSYCSHRYDATTWFVTQTKDACDERSKSIIATFNRVRTVTLCDDRLVCDCPHGRLYGLPCWHEIHVASKISTWYFPSHHDGSVIWWKSYYYYGMSTLSSSCAERETIYKSFHLLKQTESIGLQIDPTKFLDVPIDGTNLPTEFIYDPNNPFAINYPTIKYLDIVSYTDNADTIQGLTQLSSIAPNNELDELDTFF